MFNRIPQIAKKAYRDYEFILSDVQSRVGVSAEEQSIASAKIHGAP
jgi:hypothetical protein